MKTAARNKKLVSLRLYSACGATYLDSEGITSLAPTLSCVCLTHAQLQFFLKRRRRRRHLAILLPSVPVPVSEDNPKLLQALQGRHCFPDRGRGHRDDKVIYLDKEDLQVREFAKQRC